MVSRYAGRRAHGALVLFVVILFIVDAVLLARVISKERRLAADARSRDGEQTGQSTETENREADEIRAAYATLRTQADTLRSEVERLEGESAALRQTVKTRFADHETLRSETTRLGAQLAETQEALAVTRKDLAAANERLETQEAKLKVAAGLAADLAAARKKRAAEKQRADQLQKSLDETNSTLEAARKLIDRKTQETETLKARVAELEKQLADTEAADTPGQEQGQ